MSDSSWDPGQAGGANSPPSAAELAAASAVPTTSPGLVEHARVMSEGDFKARNEAAEQSFAQSIFDKVYGEPTYTPPKEPADFTDILGPTDEQLQAQQGQRGEEQAVETAPTTSAPAAPAQDPALLQVVQTLVQALVGQGQKPAETTQAQLAQPVQSLSPAARQAQEAQASLEAFFQNPEYRQGLFDRINAQRGVAPGDPAYLDVNNRRDLEMIEGRLQADARIAATEAKLEAIERASQENLKAVRFEAIAQQADQLFDQRMAPYAAMPQAAQDQLAQRVADQIQAGQSPQKAIEAVFSDPITAAYLKTLGKPPTPPKAPARHQRVEAFIATPNRANGRTGPQLSSKQRIEMMERGIWDLPG